MPKLAPYRPLPTGMSEYFLILVAETGHAELDTEAVVSMSRGTDVPQVAMRRVSLDRHGLLQTLKLRFGAYDDEHARVRCGAAVQAAMRLGTVQGVALMQNARFVITAHASLA